MYTLRLLGTTSIEGSSGPVTGRAGQGRRLALLALLVLARGRALSRDKLVAVLWPEASPERARPQLSDAVYVLRSGLGEDVVRSAGDGLALNPDAITSDVALFERMREEGRLEEAVALYRGPLLDGFHIPDSVEFENWLDGERARLGREYGQTLEDLAEAAERDGTPAVAVEWWRRRAAHDPFNGRVTLRLMRSLNAAGDRAGALQHARIHAKLLREELDAEPDAEVAAFADHLRNEPPQLAAPKSLPPPPRTSQPVTSSAPASAGELQTAAARPPLAGELRTAPQPPSASDERRVPPAVLAAVAAGLVLALVLALALTLPRNAAPAPVRSVGVLPFVNMSPEPANTYFSDGLSEQIIHALSRIDGLRVAARTSSFALRDRELSVRAIADTLDVQAVLEGSVLVDGERLRVIAQLIDARTGYHIWSEQYDGDLHDAFGVQDRVAMAIADALYLRVAGSATGPTYAGALDLEAYDLYLRGLYLRNSLGAEALRQASEYFDRVIELEPRFAHAWAAKASVIAPQAYYRYARRDSVVAQLRMLTAQALHLEPTLGEAHVSLGVLKLFYDWDWDAAGAALRRAVELNPNDAHAWHHLANYHGATGSIEDAISVREKAVQLDPLNARYRIVLARDYLAAGEHDRALEQARRAAQLDPVHPLLLGTGPGLPVGAGEIFLRQGRYADAVEEYLRVATLRGATLDEMAAMREAYASAGMPAFWRKWLDMDLRQAGPSPDPVRMAALRLLMGDTVQALDWLDRAFDERHPALVFVRRDPALSEMRAHPRIQRIARAMRLPD